MSRVNVEDMLKAYDKDVRRILNSTQWRVYDDEYRQELSSQIFMTIETQRQTFKRQQRQ
jgi:Rod binding domain-containing protein